MKEKKPMLNPKKLFETLNVKTLEPSTRGSLLNIIGTRFFDVEDLGLDFVLRIPFSDYGDLTISADTFNYLVLCYCNIIKLNPNFLDNKVLDENDPHELSRWHEFNALRSILLFAFANASDFDSFVELYQSDLDTKQKYKMEVSA